MVGLETGVPTLFGILTTDNIEQAIDVQVQRPETKDMMQPAPQLNGKSDEKHLIK